jgi:hypothetical protein
LFGQSTVGVLVLNRGANVALRRSVTRVFAGTPCDDWTDIISAGAFKVRRATSRMPPPAPGETLLIVDDVGVEMFTVAEVGSSDFTVAQPVPRALRPSRRFTTSSRAIIRYFKVSLNSATTPQTVALPVLVGDGPEIYAGGNTTLALDRSVDAFAVGTVVGLSDGLASSAHYILQAETVEERTQLTVAGLVPAEMRVAFLSVCGAFAYKMRVAGYDHSEGVLAAGASQLEIDGTPEGLRAGLDLVIGDGVHSEGARIALALALSDRTRISLSNSLEFPYAVGDAVLYRNVVAVTHGASAPEEILGGGNPVKRLNGLVCNARRWRGRRMRRRSAGWPRRSKCLWTKSGGNGSKR